MKLLILYRPNSEQARVVEDFARDFLKQNSRRKLELMNIDTREGIAMASLYDVMSHPVVLALADDGQLIKQWPGPSMPLSNELAFYAAG